MTHAITLATPRGAVTGIEEDGAPGRPLLVCIPGGSYNSRYFDVPGHSLFQLAHEQGFAVAALDRPGYQGSDPLDEVSFAGNAETLDAAVEELWKRHSDRATGVVLIGHSIGGAIAVHMAGRSPSWPLLGISITSVHTDAPDAVKAAWNSMPPDISIPFTREQRVQFMYGPEGTYDPDVVDAAEISADMVPVAELLEIVDGWVSDFPRLAAAVRVPVHYALADNEALWISTDDNVKKFGDAFTNSPSVVAERVTGSGHNLDHHRASPALHARQLEFAASLA